MAALEGATHIVRYVNPAFCRLVGRHSEELVGIPFARAVPEAATCLPQLDQVYRTGKPETCVAQVNAAAHPRHWSYVAWAVPGASSRPAGVMLQVTDTTEADAFRERATAMNQELMLASVRQHELTERADQLNAELQEEITERKRAEDEVRKSRDELELRVQERTEALSRQAELLELAHNAIIVRDMENNIIFWNHGAEEMYGWTRDEAKETSTRRFLKTKFPVSRDEVMKTLVREGKWEGEVEQVTRDGRKITVLSRRAVQWDQGGHPAAIMEINLDITAARQAEEQLRQSQKMEAIGTLAGGIAHDFNNILAAIIGFTEMVLDDVADNKDVQHKMERVLKAAFRGRDLVKHILAFSRKAAPQRKEITLTSLVKETHALLRSSLPSTIQMPLVITTGDDHVLADSTQLQQVLMNLATNAAYAMREDGGRLTTRISSVTFPQGSILPDADMEPGDYVKLTVQDTGVGMTKEVRQRIFEPFFTTKGPGEGTGMGLAVVYGVVKNLGGTVTVQSEPGEGSTFEVLLPQAQRPDTKKEEAAASVLPTGTERILFVDDEELLVEMTRGMLEGLGYHVTVTANGMDAWNLFRENPSRFDLVITDQTMPDLTGVKLAQKMLKARKDTPIILCTGYSEMVSAEKAKEAGISAFVTKPVVRKELAETVRRVLDGRTAGV
jgi:PAS domain S-box-containing protein